jgi:signal peptidase I
MLPALFAFALLTCPSQQVTVRGDSLAPLVKEGQTLEVYPVSCAQLAHGDLAVFRTAANKKAPVIKRVEGLPGDRLTLAKDGTVLVNGKPALAADGKPYKTTAQGGRMISLYAGAIPPATYLLLGAPGTLDSGRIGLVGLSEIVGVVKKGSLPKK